MNTRVCGKCGARKMLPEFNIKRGEQRQAYCRTCQAVYQAAYYKQNKAEFVASCRARKRSLREWYNTLKAKPCVDCKQDHPHWRLDFDHRPGTGKVTEVSKLVALGRSKAVIEAEIAKCDLVCELSS